MRQASAHAFILDWYKMLQGRGVPMSYLSNSGLFVGRQVDFARGLVHGQVNLREIQYRNIQFRILSMARNALILSTRFKAFCKRHPR